MVTGCSLYPTKCAGRLNFSAGMSFCLLEKSSICFTVAQLRKNFRLPVTIVMWIICWSILSMFSMTSFCLSLGLSWFRSFYSDVLFSCFYMIIFVFDIFLKTIFNPTDLLRIVLYRHYFDFITVLKICHQITFYFRDLWKFLIHFAKLLWTTHLCEVFCFPKMFAWLSCCLTIF